jgi:hypothetical protein
MNEGRGSGGYADRRGRPLADAGGGDSLVRRWLQMTGELLDGGVTGDELRDLVAMEDKVRELADRTVTDRSSDAVFRDEAGVVYRRVAEAGH